MLPSTMGHGQQASFTTTPSIGSRVRVRVGVRVKMIVVTFRVRVKVKVRNIMNEWV